MNEIRELAQIAAQAIRDEGPDTAEVLEKLREAAFPTPPELDPAAAFLSAVPRAAEADDDEDAAAILRAALPEPGAAPVRSDWPLEDPPAREWIVPDWLPAGRLALFTGEGEAGKSRLAVQLAAAIASGRTTWLPGGPGLTLPRGAAPAVIATWEDDHDEAWRRLPRAIRPELGNRLHVADLAQVGPVWVPTGSGHTSNVGSLSPTGKWLRDYVERHEARLLILDPLAAAFALNENDRALVRGFCSDWDGWARMAGCAVLLIAHPPKGTAKDGAARYSGSTDWRNAARAVWSLEKAGTPGTDGKPDASTPAMKLACDKASYARRPARLWLAGWPTWEAVQPGVAARDYASEAGTTFPSGPVEAEAEGLPEW